MSSLGVNRHTGAALSGWSHVVQSITDILTTPKGTRVMRRDYGSDLPKLIDAPMNTKSLLDIYSAIATALNKWEPRFELTHVFVSQALASGEIGLTFTGIYYPRGHLGDFSTYEDVTDFNVRLS